MSADDNHILKQIQLSHEGTRPRPELGRTASPTFRLRLLSLGSSIP
jgi:hypothetical protein